MVTAKTKTNTFGAHFDDHREKTSGSRRMWPQYMWLLQKKDKMKKIQMTTFSKILVRQG